MKKRINVALLRKVKRHILAEPGRIIMGEGLRFGEPGEGVDSIPYEADICCACILFPACGTVGCIAGWSSLLGAPKARRTENWKIIQARATKLLNLTDWEAMTLFNTDDWPEEFIRRYWQVKTQDELAGVVADRIDHFIAVHMDKE